MSRCSVLPPAQPPLKYGGETLVVRLCKNVPSCSKSFGEDEFKAEERQSWSVRRLSVCAAGCTSLELTEQLNLIIYVALLIKCLPDTECLWLLVRQRAIGVIRVIFGGFCWEGRALFLCTWGNGRRISFLGTLVQWWEHNQWSSNNMAIKMGISFRFGLVCVLFCCVVVFKSRNKYFIWACRKTFIGRNMSRYLWLIHHPQNYRVKLFILIFSLIAIVCLKWLLRLLFGGYSSLLKMINIFNIAKYY